MTLEEVCETLSWDQIVTACGGPLLERGRCPAWFRDGENKTTLSFNEEKGVGYDFATDQGFNKVGFVLCTNIVNTKQEAAEFLAGILGVTLGDTDPQAAREARIRAENRKAELKAISTWRHQYTCAIAAVRNLAWDRARRLDKKICRMDPDDPETWKLVKFEFDSRERGDAINEYIKQVLSMTIAEIKDLRLDLHRSSR